MIPRNGQPPDPSPLTLVVMCLIGLGLLAPDDAHDPNPTPEPVEPDLPEHPPPQANPPGPPASVIDGLCDRVEQATRVGLPLVCR